MIQLLKKLLGMNETIDLKQIVAGGATILDVRTVEEYKSGHLPGSLNLPLQGLNTAGIEKLKIDKSKPIITCCASGMRSASAKRILEQQGFEVYNGGGWHSLKNRLS
jgi:rhodanese-related sulfurtransferase